MYIKPKQQLTKQELNLEQLKQINNRRNANQNQLATAEPLKARYIGTHA